LLVFTLRVSSLIVFFLSQAVEQAWSSSGVGTIEKEYCYQAFINTKVEVSSSISADNQPKKRITEAP
jgi:hypothetical protein